MFNKPGVETSTGTSTFDIIMEQLADLAPKGDTLLMGDFNARTSELEDFDIQSENPAFTTLNTCHDFNDNQLPHRHNCDRIVNKNGQLLIDLCRSTEHRIINGRFVGDSMGFFTFLSQNGKSCVDYFIASQTLFQFVKHSRVTPAQHLSDHCQLDMSLEFESPSELRETPPITYSLPLYDKFIINDSHRDQFVISLLDEDSQNKLAAFLTESYDNKPETVNQAVAHLTEILVTAGKKTFKLKATKATPTY